jgi:hypothetical protein
MENNNYNKTGIIFEYKKDINVYTACYCKKNQMIEMIIIVSVLITIFFISMGLTALYAAFMIERELDQFDEEN